ncbi:MAG: SGNH/GDSL hydrolase family protein [Planctomycetota bacterium]|jgi:hypothetical protein
MTRIRLLPLTILAAFALTISIPEQSNAAEPLAPTRSADGINWLDIRGLGLEGQGWSDVKAPFDRLPGRAEKTVRGAVWNLSRHSAGMAVRFVTDATTIHAHWKLTSASLAMPHMPATGVSGLDLYVKHDGRWRWIANGRPTKQENTIRILSGIPAGTREYLLYLPLYNGVELVEVGVPEGNTLSVAPPRESGRKPIVFYGTSITHGACASRPGMVHTAILGRWLDAPVINLGFSGNGRMEAEVATLLAELDVSVFVIDCLPNIGAADVASRTEPLVKILRKKHPTTPIVLVEDRSYADSFLVTSKRERNETSRVELKAAFERLKAAGDQHLYYIKGEGMLGDDDEGTVDTSHPNDLGFMRQAEAFRKVIKPLLK